MLTRIDRLRPVYFVSEKLALDIAINLTYTSGVETKQPVTPAQTTKESKHEICYST